MSHVTTDRVRDDLKQVVHDAEELIKATAGQAGEKVAQARARAEATLTSAKEQLAAMGDTAVSRAREAGQQADEYVRDNPWTAVIAGAAVGLLVGLLVGRSNGGGRS